MFLDFGERYPHRTSLYIPENKRDSFCVMVCELARSLLVWCSILFQYELRLHRWLGANFLVTDT
jgi:hypothetical protein